MSKKSQFKYVSVKNYASLINKSDKTVYKMIKEGLVAARKGEKGYEVRVDNFMINRSEEINKSLRTMKALIESFELRLDALEKKGVNKDIVEKKLVKPLKKLVKKPLAKPAKKSSAKSNATKK